MPLALLDEYATMYKGVFTNRPKYQNFVVYIDDAHVDPRTVHED